MCKYCESPKVPIKDDEKDANVKIFVGRTADVRFYDDGYGWQDVEMEFLFCPKCGVRLKEVAK